MNFSFVFQSTSCLVFILQTSKETRKTDIYAIEELVYAHRVVVPCFVILRSQICPGKKNAT